MTIVASYTLQVGESRDLSINYAESMSSGDTISTSTWASSGAGVTVGGGTNTTTTTTIRATGVTSGASYLITNTVTTANGEIIINSLDIYVGATRVQDTGFTYNANLGDNLSLVRFHIGDTDPNNVRLEDETISALIAAEGTVEKAVVKAIRHLIALLTMPNFKADWLEVDNATARAGYQQLLAMKQAEFGLASGTGTIRRFIRSDRGE